MSIQIITDMNAKTKICAIADNKHVELYSEGGIGDMYNTLATLIASTLTKTAEDFIKDEERYNKLESEFGDKLNPLDAAIIFMRNKLDDLVAKQLTKEKVERDMLDGLPDELKKIISGAVVEKIIDEIKKTEDNEDE